jgi:hypothetical protein
MAPSYRLKSIRAMAPSYRLKSIRAMAPSYRLTSIRAMAPSYRLKSIRAMAPSYRLKYIRAMAPFYFKDQSVPIITDSSTALTAHKVCNYTKSLKTYFGLLAKMVRIYSLSVMLKSPVMI